MIIRPIRLVPSGANATDHATHGHKQIQASRKVLDEPGVGGVASDDVIEQGLGEGREDEAAKERLEREHGELLEELCALIPGAEVLFGFLLAIRLPASSRN